MKAAPAEIQKVTSVTGGLGKEIKDIRDEATRRDQRFAELELEQRLDLKMKDMLALTQAASASAVAGKTGPSQSGGGPGDDQSLIIGGWSGQQLADQIVPLAKQALGTHELIRDVYSRFRRPRVIHIRPVKGEAFRLLRDLRRTVEERDRIRPIGAIYGLWLDSLKLVGDGSLDVKAKWKIDEESVTVTRDNWASSYPLLQRINGQLKTTPDDEWRDYMRNSRLEEMLKMVKSQRTGAPNPPPGSPGGGSHMEGSAPALEHTPSGTQADHTHESKPPQNPGRTHKRPATTH